MSAEVESFLEQDYDPIVAQVIQRRMEVACREAAVTLNRTSGSPIVTEGNDFSNSLIDPDGNVLSFSGYLPPHFVSGINAIRDLIKNVPSEDIHPGDHFAANDPFSTASLHSADINVLSPIFYEDALAAWAFSDVHVFDIGGLTPGGWIPGTFDRYGEGFHFPLTKIVSQGHWNSDFEKIYLANVRLPQSLNDIRSCVAANNTAYRRIEELLDRYGLDEYRRYAQVNLKLSESLARERVGNLPDGTYEASDWAEYDGHGIDRLFRINVKIVIRGEELIIDLRDSPPQVDGFINTSRAARLGWAFADAIRTLFPDLPINAGLTSPVRVLSPAKGTMLNPAPDAATSGGHMEAGSKVLRAFHEALQKAVGLSEAPEIRSRVAALGGSVAPHNVVAGHRRDGTPEMWVSLDSLGTGLGAQINTDGRDAGCYEDMTATHLLDTELEEQSAALHLYRRLLPDSGGPGFRRGGLALDTAWCIYGMDAARVTMFSNNTRVPTRSPGGGFLGCGSGNRIHRGFDVLSFVSAENRMATADDLPGEAEVPPSHGTYVPLDNTDCFRAFCAGGAGLGDPLQREPDRVFRDVEDGFVTTRAAKDVYGVVIAGEEVDADATAARRAQLRTARLGSPPAAQAAPMEEYRFPLVVLGSGDDRTFACAHCDRSLCPTTRNWKHYARTSSWPLSERAEYLGIPVRPRDDPQMMLWEFYCPACASLLEANVYEEGEEPGRDIRLGEIEVDDASEPL